MRVAAGGSCRWRCTRAAGELIVLSTPDTIFVISHAGMPFTQTGRLRAQTHGAFAAVYLLWGSTYLAIAVAVQSIPPFLLIGVRSLAAGAILFGFAEFRSPGMPPARAWASAAASGVLLFGGCHGTLAYAEKYVSSGLAAVMLATIPFWIVLIKFVIPSEDRPKTMTLAALVPGLAGVALFVLPTGPARGRPDRPGNGADPYRIGFPVGARFDRFATGEPVHTGNNLGRDAAPLWRGCPPCREFAQRRTCGIFTLANIADLVGWSRLSDARWMGSRLYSLCLAPRSCASAVGRDLHLRQSDHCRRIGMGAPWRTPDIADVGWLRARCRFSNRGVAARSRVNRSKKYASPYVTGVYAVYFATFAFGGGFRPAAALSGMTET
jgi:hypothetical protein